MASFLFKFGYYPRQPTITVHTVSLFRMLTKQLVILALLYLQYLVVYVIAFE